MKLSLLYISFALLFACAGPVADDAPSPSSHDALVTEGRQRASACTGCHGVDLAGSSAAIDGIYAPNLTPDVQTGLGSWSDEQVKNAILTGTDDQGSALCTTMPRFSTLSDDGALALVAYLRSVDPISRPTPEGKCKK
jgi:mono/diheme cytochrome c family protein